MVAPGKTPLWNSSSKRLWVGLLLLLCGCTPPLEYIRNGFKVGPNYATPDAAVAPKWIDADDKRVHSTAEDYSTWWNVFQDATLNQLIDGVYRQNLTLKQAGKRILEARAQLGIATGNLFPQVQQLNGSFNQTGLSAQDTNVQINTPLGLVSLQTFYPQWNLPIGAAQWEIDFWGRFRRAIESSSDQLEASVADYEDVLVTLISDTAASYAAVRTIQKRIDYTLENIQLQRETLKIVQSRFDVQVATGVDLHQARSTLAQTESQIPGLQTTLRQTENHLCTLLGIPTQSLRDMLGKAKIPAAGAEAAVGIPAELLRRRPDIRRAERRVAAQCAQIGIAEAEFYPAFFINGTIGWSAAQFSSLFGPSAFTGTIGPSFQWNVLNYGRILNNLRLQKAKFEETVAAYQETVLEANQEVENGLAAFLFAQQRERFLRSSADDAKEAARLGIIQYEKGTVDFTRVTQLQQTLVLIQDMQAQAQGDIARGLIQVYKGLGGGWEMSRGDGGGQAYGPAGMPCAPAPSMPPVQPQLMGPMTLPDEAEPTPR